MNKFILNSCLAGLLVFCTGPLTPHSVFAVEENDDCSEAFFISYFPNPLVDKTLKKYNITDSQAQQIMKALAEKDGSVIKIVEQKASKLNPNPLSDPQKREDAIKLFRETLIEVFSTVLKENGISDDKQIQAMLDEIQMLKAQRFSQCMKNNKLPQSFKDFQRQQQQQQSGFQQQPAGQPGQ